MMDLMNSRFQQRLEENNFPLYAVEKEDEWVYQGKLALSDTHTVPFSIAVSKSPTTSFVQITYQQIGYIKAKDSLLDWYETINTINREKGMYYYFSVDETGEVFARYVSEVSDDWDNFFNIMIKGATLVKEVKQLLEERFGKIVRI